MRLACWLISLCIATYCARAQNANACQEAIDATIFATKIVAQARNVTFALAAQAADVTPGVNGDLVAAYTDAARNVSASLTQLTSNNAPFFPNAPFAHWGSRLLQMAMGQAIHVPSATLGELAFIANSLTRSTNASTPFAQAAAMWDATIAGMTDRLLEEAMNNTDAYSKRSLLLRYTVYSFLRQWPLTPTQQTVEQYEAAMEAFQEASELFLAYQFKSYNMSFNNGTANVTLRGFLAAASSERSPLMLIFGSIWNWKEIAFFRYGLGALRRGFAVAVAEQPGQVSVTSRPPYMPAYPDYTSIGNDIVRTIEADREWSRLIDTQQVYIMGIVPSGYSAARACAGMGSRVKGCILNPALYDFQELSTTILVRAAFAPLRMMAASNPGVFPSPALAEAYANPAQRIVRPLLLNCSASSAAPGVLAALMNTLPYDPDIGHAIISMQGALSPSTYENYMNHVWPAFHRAATLFPPWNPSAIQAPVIILGGAQDVFFGGQEQGFFDRLDSSVKRRSKLIMFADTTGGALMAQFGAGILFEQAVYPWLYETMNP